MKHPTSEEWMAFLYHEDEPAKRAELQAHAHDCTECAARLRTWSAGRRVLDDWPVRIGQQALSRRTTFPRLVAAAVLMLCIGLLIGRGLRQQPPNLAQFKADILMEL